MTFGRYILLHVPPLVLGTVIVTLSVAVVITGLLLVRRFIPTERLRLHNDVAGFLFGTVGVIYAVLLAFTVIVVWENYEKAYANVDREGSCIANLFRNVEQLDPAFVQRAFPVLREYITASVTYDWEATSRGEISPQMFAMQGQLWKLLGSYAPRTPTEQVFFEMTVQKMNDLSDLRRMRLLASRAGVDDILWCVLIAGGMITVIFTFLFGMKDSKAQVIMTALLTALISLILFTVLEYDYPFTGSLSIPPDSISHNLRFFKCTPPAGQAQPAQPATVR
ncbi:MAG: DUF4239 domain-containing protein [Kiritimatiellaeota bacterium]|nr:DUF4239 domain-containing protein [Kiritimatiellota bacterium]